MSNTRIAINGFGRIGRLAMRSLLDMDGVEVVAVNDLADNAGLAYLFKRDSVQGRFDGDVTADDTSLTIRGKTIQMTSIRDPRELPWRALGVDVVLECTGVFLERDKAAMHLAAGARRVLLSAPGKGVDLTVCMGVNDGALESGVHEIVSNASCTTNCVSPPIKALHDAFTVTSGVINTIHAYTINQSLLDAPRKKLRLSRAAALNLVPSTTGAAKAVGLVMPDLDGKLDGLAIRTPNPTGSIADITLTFERDPTVEEAHAVLRAYAEANPEVMWFCEEDIVSTDVIGDTHSSIVDSQMTMKQGGLLKLLCWYDNEAGYATRLAQMGVKLARL